MRTFILPILSCLFGSPVLAQGAINCSPLCTVQCGSKQIAICKTDTNGQCTTRCLDVPTYLKDVEREAFILSAVLERPVEVKEVKQDDLQMILSTGKVALDGKDVQFREVY